MNTRPLWFNAAARRFTAALACFALCSLGVSALGATTISPVIIDVPSDGRATVTVHNDSPREVLYQVTVMDWHLVNGADIYAPTQNFIASPPIFTLAPLESQIIRIGFRNPRRQILEQAYLLKLAEVPHLEEFNDEGGRVQFAIQYLLPVFVEPTDQSSKSALIWSLRADGDSIIVRADNPGTSRIALNIVGLSSQPGFEPTLEVASSQRTTVLANAWREWRFLIPGNTESRLWRIVALLSGNETLVVVPYADTRHPIAR